MHSKFLNDDTVLVNYTNRTTKILRNVFINPSKGEFLGYDDRFFNELHTKFFTGEDESLKKIEDTLGKLQLSGKFKKIERIPLPMPIFDSMNFNSLDLPPKYRKGSHSVSLDEFDKIVKDLAEKEKNKGASNAAPEVTRGPGDKLVPNEPTIYLTYLNSLIVNDTIIVPRYQKVGSLERSEKTILGFQFRDKIIFTDKFLDAKYFAAYEREVNKVLGKYFKRVKWVNADNLIIGSGSVHCVTMQVPKIPPAGSWPKKL